MSLYIFIVQRSLYNLVDLTDPTSRRVYFQCASKPMPRKKKTPTENESLPETQESSREISAKKPPAPTPEEQNALPQDIMENDFPII
jgi:hypothetical protein